MFISKYSLHLTIIFDSYEPKEPNIIAVHLCLFSSSKSTPTFGDPGFAMSKSQ